LTKTSLGAIWQIWKKLCSHMGQGRLPLCPSHFKGDGWKDYFPLLYKILKDMEAAGHPQEAGSVEPVKRPTMRWARREAKEIMASTMVEPSASSEPCPEDKDRPRTSPKTVERAAKELVNAIVKQRPFNRDLPALKCLTKEQEDKLAAKAAETIDEINSNSFRPKRYLQQRGLHRLFHIIPQHTFATRYFPIDTWVCSCWTVLFRLIWR
jgi:hypothetical protein